MRLKPTDIQTFTAYFMMKAFPLLLLTSLVLAGTNCKKEAVQPPQDNDQVLYTTLRLKVVDEYSDAPVPDAVCILYGVGDGYILRLDTVISDQNGILQMEFYKFYTKVYYTITRGGYVSKIYKPFVVEPGQINDLKIPMRPFDAVVKLEVENVQAYPDTLFFNLLNGGAIGDAGNKPFLPFTSPLFLQPAEKFTAYIPALGDDAVSVFWTWNINEMASDPPFKNVVVVPTGDTLTYKITN